jgi:4-diphosphocytidyl-2-C-methyl-D-erythritol kinase
VETPVVFRALSLQPGQDLAGASHPNVEPNAVIDALKNARNDLEPPALTIQPLIGEALDLLRRTKGCHLARMSGSGATVFGLYDSCEIAAEAAKAVRRERPDWWVKTTSLR